MANEEETHSINPPDSKLRQSTARKNLQGYLPPVDHIAWTEIGLDEEQCNELDELLEEAKLSNMLVNELMARMLTIVEFQNQIAAIFDVSPTIVSKRLKGQIGVMDRVQRDKMAIIGETRYITENEQDFPYTEKLRDMMVLYGVHGTVTDRIVQLYISNIDRFDTPEGLYELLRNLNFGPRRAELLTTTFFNLEVMPNVRRHREA